MNKEADIYIIIDDIAPNILLYSLSPLWMYDW
jgi:hypothetical protein